MAQPAVCVLPAAKPGICPVQAKTRWLPGQPSPRWEDMSFAHGAGGQPLHSPFNVKDG